MSRTCHLLTALILLSSPLMSQADEALDAVIAGDHRTPSFAQRDGYRHPGEVLEFFGLRQDQKVAEIWPSSGWWSEILAPYLRDSGSYYAVGYSLTANRTPRWRQKMAKELIQKFADQPAIYDQAIVTSLSVPEDTEIAPPSSLDMVLTFRNVHNWMKGDYAPGVFQAMFKALKPGGTMGLVEHRAPEDRSLADMKMSGYITESHVIALATDAGFELLERSEINANPADNHTHPAGVWSLPPSLRGCGNITDEQEKAECVTRYRNIGESDRMTLKFGKPKS
jgi:predicted methyltransferase